MTKVYVVTKEGYDSAFPYADRVFTTRERAKQYCDDERDRIQAKWEADEQKCIADHDAAMLAWHKKMASTNGKAMAGQPWRRWNGVERYSFEYDEYELED